MLRIGILGAAKIAPNALIKPARDHEDVVVAAVAARDNARAQEFANKHGISRVHRSYADLLADSEIDAIYNPLPNGLHGHWTVKAIEAGKHVLCEKPFTANANEAEEVAAVAAAHPELVVMEAFHWRYHPLANHLREIIVSGELGTLQNVDTYMCIPLPLKNDIRFNFELAGGSAMDVGCYAIHMNRVFADAEPKVVSAQAKVLKREPRIDRWIAAKFQYDTGFTGTVTAALWSGALLKIGLRIVGSEGELRCFNPTQPGLYHRASLRGAAGKRDVGVSDKRASYWHQLGAFSAAIAGDRSRNITGCAEAISNMRVIDDVYAAAGLPVRQPSS